MNSKKYGAIVRLVGVGWYVGICIGVGAWAGLWADSEEDLKAGKGEDDANLIGLPLALAGPSCRRLRP